MQRKPDDLAIGAFFDELASQPWLGYQRRRWPEFFFHVTNIENAASILKSGRLLSRRRAIAEQRMATDNASAEVLQQSDPKLFDYARLYFRPRTPTFSRNEGIRPIGYRWNDAHCPVPVALLFAAKAVAGRAGVLFSDGNLASRSATLGGDVAFLRTLDFRDIYHDAPPRPADAQRIRARRQAEIVVPGELPLDDLEFIVTRSDAERQTLLALLAETAWSRPPSIETVLVHSGFFHCHWTFIERVTLAGDQLRILFNPDSQTPGPFDVNIAWTNPATDATAMETMSLRGLGHQSVPVPAGFQGPAVRITVHLDDALAFAGRVDRTPSSTLLEPR